jgi:hypothetical protein
MVLTPSPLVIGQSSVVQQEVEAAIGWRRVTSMRGEARLFVFLNLFCHLHFPFQEHLFSLRPSKRGVKNVLTGFIFRSFNRSNA